MFELYLIILICPLLLICYLITNSLTSIYIQIKVIRNIKEIKRQLYLENDYILYISYLYMKRKKWLCCITMLEFYIDQIKINEIEMIGEFYNCIGLCYQAIEMYKIAKRYYLEACKRTPLQQHILKNLANIYNAVGDIKNANKIYQRIT
uniref:Uncharacterized protein n=1 Tax=Agarophyton chilense TaxID=2510777 RepID=A0A141SEQ1_AGACH|nr:hypothetical protein Gchil_118 [Agarophyton chilense]AMK96769.1 hypothetical protein Gchil_118 [Agarophyton chilense]ASP44664.1 hypothetical protein [Agarophyton chilense]UAD84301.1 hypothetical protein [Agarophyton chilense]